MPLFLVCIKYTLIHFHYDYCIRHFHLAYLRGEDEEWNQQQNPQCISVSVLWTLSTYSITSKRQKLPSFSDMVLLVDINYAKMSYFIPSLMWFVLYLNCTLLGHTCLLNEYMYNYLLMYTMMPHHCSKFWIPLKLSLSPAFSAHCPPFYCLEKANSTRQGRIHL